MTMTSPCRPDATPVDKCVPSASPRVGPGASRKQERSNRFAFQHSLPGLHEFKRLRRYQSLLSQTGRLPLHESKHPTLPYKPVLVSSIASP